MPAKSDRPLAGLGNKYGATVRKRYSRVVRELKAKRVCRSCGSASFSRKAVGVWRCRKCGYTVAGGAYSF
ncbi:MAG: 50S ribosomal protein L37 [Nitrososphaerota archaeon]|nr:50S ribosomal protein L37 [Nitrososphaerota archaeon]MDG6939562.1 50S ribosomal protein L37 [Nitrososphaerota archaeon]